MKEYIVTVREILSDTYAVEAGSKEEARRMIERRHHSGDIELTEIPDVEFKVEIKEVYAKTDIENFLKNKESFSSAYADIDWPLPYAFDLHHDIKTEAELLLELEGIGSSMSCHKDVSETALEYGYAIQYLREKYGKKGRLIAWTEKIDDIHRVYIEQELSNSARHEDYDSKKVADDRVDFVNESCYWSWEKLDEASDI